MTRRILALVLGGWLLLARAAGAAILYEFNYDDNTAGPVTPVRPPRSAAGSARAACGRWLMSTTQLRYKSGTQGRAGHAGGASVG